jgi:hypothetical protein
MALLRSLFDPIAKIFGMRRRTPAAQMIQLPPYALK